MEKVYAPNCGQENDLIGFLYGELNETDALAFQRHLHACSACNTELAGFGGVREWVVAWRNESLGSIGLPTQIPARAVQARPSAIAALREFFNLSPLWMKGALAFATLLFCVFGALALAHLRDKSAVVKGPVAPVTSQQELNAQVERRVQEELNRIENARKETAAPLTANNSSRKDSVKRVANRGSELAFSVSSQKARRPLSRSERQQLAADLRLVAAKGDSDLGLLDDTINQ